MKDITAEGGSFSSIVGITEKPNENFRPPKEEYISHFNRLLQKMEKIISKLEKPESTELIPKKPKEKSDIPPIIIKKDALSKNISELKINQKNENSYIIFKIFSEVAYTKYLVFLGEDTNGDLIQIMVYNLQNEYDNINYFSLKEKFSKGKYVLILSPFYKNFTDGFDGIKIDDPKDIFIFNTEEETEKFVKDSKGISNEEIKKQADQFIEQKNLGKALELYNKAIAINPDDPEVYTKLANIYIALPYYTKSLEYVNKACKLVPNNKELTTIKLLSMIGLKQYMESICLISNFDFFNEDEAIQKIKADLFAKVENEKGNFIFNNLFFKEKKENGYYLDIADYMNKKIGFDFNKEKGIFVYAKEALKKGDLLMAQKALVSVMQKNNETQKEMEEDSKNLISITTFKIKNSPLDNEDFFLLYDEKNLSQNITQRKLNATKPIKKEDIIKILNNNLFTSMRNLLANINVSKGIWNLPSMINHSCLPNTIFLGIGDFVFVYAQRDIKAGEELTVGYVACEVEYSERQRQLKESYNFECKCELCQFEKQKLNSTPEKKTMNEYILRMNKNLNQQNYNDLDLGIEKFLDENKKKFSCYEMGTIYYLLGLEFGKNQPQKGIEYFEKCLRYVNGRFFKLNSNCLFYLFCLNQMIGNTNKCIELKDEIYKLLKGFFRDESFTTELMRESGIIS